MVHFHIFCAETLWCLKRPFNFAWVAPSHKTIQEMATIYPWFLANRGNYQLSPFLRRAITRCYCGNRRGVWTTCCLLCFIRRSRYHLPLVSKLWLLRSIYLQKKFLFCTSNLFALQTSSLLCVPQQNAIMKSFTLVGQCYQYWLSAIMPPFVDERMAFSRWSGQWNLAPNGPE